MEKLTPNGLFVGWEPEPEQKSEPKKQKPAKAEKEEAKDQAPADKPEKSK